jgi:hypothetical protein
MARALAIFAKGHAVAPAQIIYLKVLGANRTRTIRPMLSFHQGKEEHMKARFSFALLLMVTLGTGMGQGQDQSAKDSENGYWWVNQSETYKLGFVNGYAMAMTRASDRVTFMCLAEKNGGVIPEKYPGDEALRACAQTPTAKLFDFTGIRLGQLVDGTDEFYKDFRNKGVSVTSAMFYVRDELNGKSAKELEDELNIFRHGPAPTKK